LRIDIVERRRLLVDERNFGALSAQVAEFIIQTPVVPPTATTDSAYVQHDGPHPHPHPDKRCTGFFAKRYLAVGATARRQIRDSRLRKKDQRHN
jgi:hypothetical protein